uniref:Uncharacterized protein n=1 Tax=Physcomitrium patens TaxID=3218 RepID=A0A2K1KK26_PHYPA|nr:hypothetical protein PHYPA_007806 [Physcomitrium patens]
MLLFFFCYFILLSYPFQNSPHGSCLQGGQGSPFVSEEEEEAKSLVSVAFCPGSMRVRNSESRGREFGKGRKAWPRSPLRGLFRAGALEKRFDCGISSECLSVVPGVALSSHPPWAIEEDDNDEEDEGGRGRERGGGEEKSTRAHHPFHGQLPPLTDSFRRWALLLSPLLFPKLPFAAKLQFLPRLLPLLLTKVSLARII